MMNLVSGRFYPELERQFIDQIVELKSAPWSKILVIAPTGELLNRLQILCAHRLPSLLNIHFHNLASIAEAIVQQSSPLEKPLLTDIGFFDTLVKSILKEKKPFHEMEDLAIPDGFPTAVRSTLRDLTDAGVPPDIGETIVSGDALKEAFLGSDVDAGSLRELFQLYRYYTQRLNTLPFSTRSDLMRHAIEMTPESKFLSSFQHILVYGFADMTGSQTDLIQSIARQYSVTIYLPYVADHPGYAFSKRFRDDYLLGVVSEEKSLDVHSPASPSVEIVNASGRGDEAMWVAHEIRRLHDELKIPFSDIAIIARSEDQFGRHYSENLTTLHIPFRSSQKQRLFDYPLTSWALTMAAAARSEIPFDEWEKTMRLSYWKSEVRQNLYKTCVEFSIASTWQETVLNWKNVMRMVPVQKEMAEIWEKLISAVENLSLLDALHPPASREDFFDAVEERWRTAEISTEPRSGFGVSLLYAEEARGLFFPVLFLIGLEEKQFPRIQKEDAFLRDDVRYQLRNTLGYKIAQKELSLEEERWLFTQFTEALLESLYLTYLRSDEEGKVIGASPFVRDFCSSRGWNFDEKVKSIPRSYFDKCDLWMHQLSFRDTLSYLLKANRHEDAEKLFIDPKEKGQLKRQVTCMNALQSFEAPTSFDGEIGPKKLSLVTRHGQMSPTALEQFARCPFQYFVQNVLRCDSPDDPIRKDELPPDIKGMLVHSFLELFFQRSTENGNKALEGAFPLPLFEEVFNAIFPDEPAIDDWKPHPLFWEIEKTSLRAQLLIYLQQEWAKCLQENRRPRLIESKWLGNLNAPLEGVEWVGKMDRVDEGPEGSILIDYKTGKVPSNIGKELLAGTKAQPSLYMVMAEKGWKDFPEVKPPQQFEYHKIGEENETRVLSKDDWDANKQTYLSKIKEELSVMGAGEYLLTEDPNTCRLCDVAVVCRRSHAVSFFRSVRSVSDQNSNKNSKRPVVKKIKKRKT